jgi:S-adenosylmethionine hydrolase
MKSLVLLFLAFSAAAFVRAADHALVIQTDFGVKDGAVAEMKGVAYGVSPKLAIFDLSHQNTPFDIWEAAYRLKQAAPYWPAGTVFVSVIDPGVGTDRKSVVLLTKSGHYFVTPDNGTLTLVAEELGIQAVREIDETKHRRAGSEKSYTFHGRDVYAYTGAQLASGATTFDDVGPLLPAKVVAIAYEKAHRDGDAIVGGIPVLDWQYGNVWTNLDDGLFASLAPKFGDRFHVTITHGGKTVYTGDIPYARTFGDVPEGEPLLYVNSLMNVSLALNQGSFADKHGVASGGEWGIRVEKVR